MQAATKPNRLNSVLQVNDCINLDMKIGTLFQAIGLAAIYCSISVNSLTVPESNGTTQTHNKPILSDVVL